MEKGKFTKLVSLICVFFLSFGLFAATGCSQSNTSAAPGNTSPATGVPAAQDNSSPVDAPKQKPIKMKFNYFQNLTTYQGQVIQRFCDNIYEDTNGIVTIEVFPSGTLTPNDKVFEGVLTGISELGTSCPSYTAGRFPMSDATAVPYAYKSAWTLSHMTQDWYEKFQPQEWKDYHVLCAISGGPNILASMDKKVAKPDDLKGLKIRGSGTAANAYIQAFGGTPVAIPMPEVYEAAQKGMFDGMLTGMDAQKAWNHADITKYITILPLSFQTSNFTVMNLDVWNSLSPEIQAVFDERSKQLVEDLAYAWTLCDIEGKELFLSLGGEVIEIPENEVEAWESKLTQLEETFIEAQTDKTMARDSVEFLKERAEYYKDKVPSDQTIKDWYAKEFGK